MINKILRCGYCKGSIIQNYDKIYCIQCSREPSKQTPATITDEEYRIHKRGDDSVRQRINSASQERGN